MKLPTLREAQQILAEAHAFNPGVWADHCRVAAESARAIAARHPALDPDWAYVLGLLHDIGRGAGGPGVADVRHVVDGYRFMLDRGFDDCARICLTHSFPIKQVDAFASRWDCPPNEKQFVQDYLDHVEYTAYDRLIQLCDALSLPAGPCVMEKRLVDVALRHGFNTLTVAKWQAFLAIREEFDAAVGGSIYTLLPGVVANTFGFAEPLLVIFSGPPGTGKTTLARHAAEWLRAPLFTKDELEATLWRSGIRRDANSGWAAYELLTTLASTQLRLGQSAILDSVATLERIRSPWRALAVEFGVPVRIVETICSDGPLHRARLEARQRGIPSWPELTWPEAVEVAAKFEPWTEHGPRRRSAARPEPARVASVPLNVIIWLNWSWRSVAECRPSSTWTSRTRVDPNLRAPTQAIERRPRRYALPARCRAVFTKSAAFYGAVYAAKGDAGEAERLDPTCSLSGAPSNAEVRV